MANYITYFAYQFLAEVYSSCSLKVLVNKLQKVIGLVSVLEVFCGREVDFEHCSYY